MSDRDLNDPDFWNDLSGKYSMAHTFTVPFAERALREAGVTTPHRIVDIATGNGALAIVAAEQGMHVLATDFSEGMVASLLKRKIPNMEARVMDGQALDLPDGTFDAAFSMFGVMLFADWRAGLSEMARVVKPEGVASVGTWKDEGGAATNLLLHKLCDALFPELEAPPGPTGMGEFKDPERFRAAMQSAGFSEVQIVEETHDFLIDTAMLEDPDTLFAFSGLWPLLDAKRRAVVMGVIREAQQLRDGPLPVPSTALIATARRE